MADNLFFALGGKEFYYGIYNFRKDKVRLYTTLFQDLPKFYGKVGGTPEAMIYEYNMMRLIKHFEKNPPMTTIGKELEQLSKNHPEDNPILVFGEINNP
jgi:hypothetical protein